MIHLVVETILEGSQVRLRALPEQSVSPEVRFSFSRALRNQFPVGTLFEVWASWVVPADQTAYLRVNESEADRITTDRAKEMLATRGIERKV